MLDLLIHLTPRLNQSPPCSGQEKDGARQNRQALAKQPSPWLHTLMHSPNTPSPDCAYSHTHQATLPRLHTLLHSPGSICVWPPHHNALCYPWRGVSDWGEWKRNPGLMELGVTHSLSFFLTPTACDFSVCVQPSSCLKLPWSYSPDVHEPLGTPLTSHPHLLLLDTYKFPYCLESEQSPLTLMLQASIMTNGPECFLHKGHAVALTVPSEDCTLVWDHGTLSIYVFCVTNPSQCSSSESKMTACLPFW